VRVVFLDIDGVLNHGGTLSSDAPWRRLPGDRLVLPAPGHGVYLGNRREAEFWSALDAVGQPSAVTFASAFDAWRHMRNWDDGVPEGASTYEVVPDQTTPDGGVYASVQACVAAGLPGWAP
jgi:hypothetical protein